MLVVAGLLPLSLLGIWGVNGVYEQQRRDLERATLDMSRALGSAVDAEIESSVGSLEALAYHPALLAGQHAEFYTVARDAVRARPYWASVVLTDGGGRVIFKTLMPFGAADARVIDGDSLEQVLREKRALVGQVRHGQASGPAIPVRVPVIAAGQVRYVLTAALKPDRIDELLTRQHIPEGWAITVIDSNYQRVSRSHGRGQFVGKRITPSLEKVLVRGTDAGNGVTLNAQAVESIAGYSKLSRWGLSVIVGAPASLLHKAFSEALALYAAGLALSVLACLLAARAISRRIIGGIAHVQRQAADLGRGQAVRAQSCGIAELDQLAKSLHAASVARLAMEEQREILLGNLNRSLRSVRVAMDQAQEAARAKDHFLAVLGHELRNPLAPIVSTLELMDVRGADVFQRERRILRRQVTHLHRLVDDLLDVSRIVKGKMSIVKRRLLLNDVVSRAYDSVVTTVLKRTAPLTLSLPAAEVWIDGDDDRLHQLFVNLLTNAVRHAPDADVSMTLSATEGIATIIVSDQGVGMDAETLANIFAPFYQAPQSIARSAGGLGVGLTIARSIVHMHHGKITANSIGVGHGAEFHVELPLGQTLAPELPEPPQLQRLRPVTPTRILVVDDNIDAATLMAEALAITGHDVRVAHDGTTGLAMLSDFDAHVAVLDIGLPDMDGFELARRIRAAQHSQDLALIAVTGYGQSEDRDRALRAGFDVHLAKPVALAELLIHIESFRRKTKQQVDIA
jgi:signal transduction histidine kinase/ActR/RegA family two-component response regulator